MNWKKQPPLPAAAPVQSIRCRKPFFLQALLRLPHSVCQVLADEQQAEKKQDPPEPSPIGLFVEPAAKNHPGGR